MCITARTKGGKETWSGVCERKDLLFVGRTQDFMCERDILSTALDLGLIAGDFRYTGSSISCINFTVQKAGKVNEKLILSLQFETN